MPKLTTKPKINAIISKAKLKFKMLTKLIISTINRAISKGKKVLQNIPVHP